jgi:putative phosphoribosyl transferase
MNDQVKIPSDKVMLDGELIVPQGAQGIVLYAHGRGSSRQSPRTRFVAAIIRKSGLGTLLFDLLTPEEAAEDADAGTTHLRFEIGPLAKRFLDATRWIASREDTGRMGPGYFGVGTDAAVALSAAAEIGCAIHAVVSHGGRPDLAGDVLPRVLAPTLLTVGSLDPIVHRLNAHALAQLQCEKELVVVEGASHTFEEAGKLNEVAQLTAEWFREHLRPR